MTKSHPYFIFPNGDMSEETMETVLTAITATIGYNFATDSRLCLARSSMIHVPEAPAGQGAAVR
ncbi:MAG: hypothetical protein FJX25_09295 [Alphaproteobacteria bacterium]|nr:hypothetical protein [Alphaproteobacteria bacterium]